jgi:uncharacterized protein YndB with AHSA1/START domain
MKENRKPMMSAINNPFVISKALDAPRELLWKAWTEPEGLRQWFGPKGSTMPVAKMDTRPGRICHFCLRSPDGHAMWGKWIFREIIEPERLLFVQTFSDQSGGIARHPLNPHWPLQMLTIVTFADQNGGTLLTVRWDPLDPTDQERQTFDSAHEGMRQGWGGSFEQLADYLKRA